MIGDFAHRPGSERLTGKSSVAKDKKLSILLELACNHLAKVG
jgi:hypothetical protein